MTKKPDSHNIRITKKKGRQSLSMAVTIIAVLVSVFMFYEAHKANELTEKAYLNSIEPIIYVTGESPRIEGPSQSNIELLSLNLYNASMNPASLGNVAIFLKNLNGKPYFQIIDKKYDFKTILFPNNSISIPLYPICWDNVIFDIKYCDTIRMVYQYKRTNTDEPIYKYQVDYRYDYKKDTLITLNTISF